MVDPLIPHFQRQARYNTLANQTIYEACAQLPDSELNQTRPAFFHSILGTLNHILIGDRIWMSRFQGDETPSTELDAILYKSFLELWAARVLEDQKIEVFFSNLTVEFINQSIRYINSAGHSHEYPVQLLITHFFNHQTHHRGQVHNLLSQTPIVPPSLDMHRILRSHISIQ
ncbi:MAG: DinB family protein [Microcoleaceae cyanobacterium]